VEASGSEPYHPPRWLTFDANTASSLAGKLKATDWLVGLAEARSSSEARERRRIGRIMMVEACVKRGEKIEPSS
jgi:hypothetical protein